MEFTTAKALMELLGQLDNPINAATIETKNIDDPVERKAIRKALARVTSMVYLDLMMPICKDFPELLPDQDDQEGT